MPHTWHDGWLRKKMYRIRLFQSTCHIRGMTRRSVSCALLVFPFQSTCHIRGMTELRARSIGAFVISIHMPHTWHDRAMLYGDWDVFISIHMPHTWHDDWRKERAEVGEISIHMPHTWHDLEGENILDPDYKFQSTCHIRGMTAFSRTRSTGRPRFQSTCHIRGMTALFSSWTGRFRFQSTCHIRGMTAVAALWTLWQAEFQSTCHIRGMTCR